MVHLGNDTVTSNRKKLLITLFMIYAAKVTTVPTGQGIRETDKGANRETNTPNDAKPTLGR